MSPSLPESPPPLPVELPTKNPWPEPLLVGVSDHAWNVVPPLDPLVQPPLYALLEASSLPGVEARDGDATITVSHTRVVKPSSAFISGPRHRGLVSELTR